MGGHYRGTDRVQTSGHKAKIIVLLTSLLLQGCATGPFHLQYFSRGDEQLSYYVDKASSIQFPTETDTAPPAEELFNAPRNIRSLDEVDPREVSINECIRMALAEAAVIRDDGSFGSPANSILSRPAQVPSVLDSAIQQTGFLFGNRGYEAALADFDALFTTSATWGRDEVPQNSANLGLSAGDTLVTDTMTWQTSLEKTFADGSTVTLSGVTNYEGNNRPVGGFSQLLGTAYSGNVQAEIRKPLAAGSGVDFTRIAGPVSQNLRGVSGVSQGVLISRINGDISQTQFEESVGILVRDVENTYWDLNLALRLYESEKDAFIQLLQYFQKLRQRADSSVPILQAEARIFEADARMRGSLADVLEKESRLRRLCHLPLSDGTFLYPTDSPTEAELDPLWEAVLQDAFANRVELRRQKWEIKSLELQLKAARSLVRPRIDFVGQSRINGLGDDLIGDHDQPFDTMAGNITSGDNTGWSFGFQVSKPVGLRLARIQVRNYELRLRKAKAVLAEQEREIAYELSAALLNMQRWFELADSTTRRIETSRQHVVSAEQLVEGNPNATSDLFNLLLQAKISQRDAEQAYMRSVIEYNKSINDMRFRKGTLLVDNEIYLAEGSWHPAAHPIAMQRAVARTHAFDRHKLKTSPTEFVGGPAPSSWESLQTEMRPETPGALGAAAVPDMLQQNGVPQTPPPNVTPPPVPEFTPPTPVPPADDIPEAFDPPPINPAPVDRDTLTRMNRALRNIGIDSELAPVAEDGGTTGRVEL